MVNYMPQAIRMDRATLEKGLCTRHAFQLDRCDFKARSPYLGQICDVLRGDFK